jgi:hypothetical protein
MARGEAILRKGEWDGELTTKSGLSKERKYREEILKEVQKSFPGLKFWFVSELCTPSCTWVGGGDCSSSFTLQR